MLMLALWAEIASPWRIGATFWEMNPDRPWLGSCSAVTPVILPAASVTWTWTCPYGSSTTAPVNVPLPLAVTVAGAGAAAEVPGAMAAWLGRLSADALPAGVLKLNSSTRARQVLTKAAMARFGMGSPDQNPTRSSWMWARETPGRQKPGSSGSH